MKNFSMKKVLYMVIVFFLLVNVVGCSNANTAETTSTIINKEVVDGNQYYFYVEYEIEGYEGFFDATIKVKNKKIYDSYEIGDTYIFDRPVQ